MAAFTGKFVSKEITTDPKSHERVVNDCPREDAPDAGMPLSFCSACRRNCGYLSADGDILAHFAFITKGQGRPAFSIATHARCRETRVES